jgi:hypothetical protein
MWKTLAAGALTLSALTASTGCLRAPARIERAPDPSASAAAGTPSPPPGKVRVATAAGSGCPAGTYAVVADRGNSSFTVTYDTFVAQAGAGAQPTDARRNCQLSLVVDAPEGYTFALASAPVHGEAHLAPGATGSVGIHAYFQGMSQTVTVVQRFSGPLTSAWDLAGDVAPADQVFRPCGERRNLNLNVEVVARAGPSGPAPTSYLAVTAEPVLVNLTWRHC